MRRKRKHEKEEDKIFVKYFSFLIQLICWVVLMYSLFEIGRWYIHNKQNENIMNEISNAIIVEQNENTEQSDKATQNSYKIDFQSLKNVNSDTIAFIKVPGTDIEYPIVKTTNNDFYLKHSLDKTYNAAGWIFMDYRNKLDGTDKNIVVYGHNRKNGSMFSSLKNVLNKQWYNNPENLKIQFITEQEQTVYEVFSVYQIEVESYYLQTEFRNDKGYESFIETIKGRSIKDFGINLNTDDEILTLSTCANDNNYRVVLHARKVKQNIEVDN